MRLGSFYKDGVVSRCQECGDSKNPMNGHFVSFPSGIGYCFRCGCTINLTLDQLLQLALGNITHEEAISEAFEEQYRERVTSERPTCLETKVGVKTDWVSVDMKDQNGNVIGYHNRQNGTKYFTNEGKRGIGYCGDTLVSTPSDPLILVEGMYDVNNPRHVCIFGTINLSTLRRYFRLQYCWLWPDPDMVTTRLQRQLYTKRVIIPAEERLVNIMGVILSNDDPDKATVTTHVTTAEWKREYY